ncbi:hypothetical protein ACFQO4_20760 [Saliphagus sp. GCM10025334]
MTSNTVHILTAGEQPGEEFPIAVFDDRETAKEVYDEYTGYSELEGVSPEERQEPLSNPVGTYEIVDDVCGLSAFMLGEFEVLSKADLERGEGDD